jgi:ATP-dependent Zn protease
VVREEWEAIFAVAKELMERETLTGEEVLRIIKEQKERVE